MTLLQQICYDMLASQERLQRLYRYEREARKTPEYKGIPTLGGGNLSMIKIMCDSSRAVIAQNLASAGLHLQAIAAANDDATLPGAA